MCDAVVPVPVPPSPKSHATERTVPSGSVDAAASTATLRPSVVAVNRAVGAALGAGAPVAVAWWAVTCSAVSVVG